MGLNLLYLKYKTILSLCKYFSNICDIKNTCILFYHSPLSVCPFLQALLTENLRISMTNKSHLWGARKISFQYPRLFSNMQADIGRGLHKWSCQERLCKMGINIIFRLDQGCGLHSVLEMPLLIGSIIGFIFSLHTVNFKFTYKVKFILFSVGSMRFDTFIELYYHKHD